LSSTFLVLDKLKRCFDNFCKYIIPPLAAQNILGGEPFLFCVEAQNKNGSPHKILSAAKPPFIHVKIVEELLKINHKQVNLQDTIKVSSKK
jgi:hypothetical protein